MTLAAEAGRLAGHSGQLAATRRTPAPGPLCISEAEPC
eukprot:CAMPEP_0206286808 /NCGR_PEP_ID=MMETSP0106_2-20121207/790_1 /ASSEMBLY_ACC=CAM_ASM_000206 /TAXON_ID=81532 /ORGANISM="Acanthoeca-like sp., Strain 10tr" /LENGTH=37 /DNA_ID= /DNA_START= /DNA_END= /DNA_ORIENTATION=